MDVAAHSAMRRRQRRQWRRNFRRRCLRSSSDGVLPDVLDRVQLRGPRRQEDRCDVFGHVELAGDVPPGPVEKHHGVCALGDVARDFVEVELHHVGVGIGKRQGRSDALRWADRAEQIGVVADRRVVLVSFRAWPTGGRGRSSGRSGLRPGTRFRSASSRTTLRDELSARAGSFFKPLDDPLVLSRMTRPGADVREAKLLQEFSDIARMKVDAEPFGNDTLGGA
jgi:hypothetical protein